MTLPYETATSGERALGDIQKILRAFGCNKFGSMIDDSEKTILVQFEYRGRQCSVKASIAGYAAAWLKAHEPKRYSSREQDLERQRKALQIASVAVYSILRDWIKGQVTAIETGILSFEVAFMGQLLLPSGRTVEEHLRENNLLPQLEAPK